MLRRSKCMNFENAFPHLCGQSQSTPRASTHKAVTLVEHDEFAAALCIDSEGIGATSPHVQEQRVEEEEEEEEDEFPATLVIDSQDVGSTSPHVQKEDEEEDELPATLQEDQVPATLIEEEEEEVPATLINDCPEVKQTLPNVDVSVNSASSESTSIGGGFSLDKIVATAHLDIHPASDPAHVHIHPTSDPSCASLVNRPRTNSHILCTIKMFRKRLF